jgi:transcriptional regulator with XRE-family HTH domain
MNQVRSITDWMQERGLSVEALLQATGLDRRIVEAIIQGRYTPSPQQRQALAAALSIAPAQVGWGHVNPVEHVFGHGPQFGRSP